MRNLFLSAIAFALSFCFAGTAFAQQTGSAGRVQDSRTQEEIANLKKQIDDLQHTQLEILQELRELRKVLESKQSDAGTEPLQQAISLNVHGEPFNGSSSAQLAIVEYSDFECPYCGQYARETFPRILADYVKTGRVRYYFRDLPLPIHQNAMLAAESARCAGEQGKFWEMHDSLFGNQAALGSKDLADRTLTLGMDKTRFLECMTSDKYSQAIRRSATGALRMGITGTPAFALGGVASNGDVVNVTQLILGYQTYDDFKQVLDEMLSAQTKPVKDH
ncbi:MAG TPA: thioredoxin domain-containing protein [Blastocatellia bacterium]|nr:thioredoxin domain-containing protein [Blastocatellia bacterium]